MPYKTTIGNNTYRFDDLKTVLAKAAPYRSGDALAGLTAGSYEERVAAQIALADIPLQDFLQQAIIPYESDEITRLIIDTHDAKAFATISHFTVGQLRDWLLSDPADTATLQSLAPGLTPEMVAANAK
jgi:ethanolamine ammonia-lyase large subunit